MLRLAILPLALMAVACGSGPTRVVYRAPAASPAAEAVPSAAARTVSAEASDTTRWLVLTDDFHSLAREVLASYDRVVPQPDDFADRLEGVFGLLGLGDVALLGVMVGYEGHGYRLTFAVENNGNARIQVRGPPEAIAPAATVLERRWRASLLPLEKPLTVSAIVSDSDPDGDREGVAVGIRLVTVEDHSCGYPLAAELRRSDDRLTVAVWGVDALAVQLCFSVGPRATWTSRPVLLSTGSYPLTFRYRGQEDRYRLRVRDDGAVELLRIDAGFTLLAE